MPAELVAKTAYHGRWSTFGNNVHYSTWVDPFDPDRVIVSTMDRLFLSEDQGETWRQIPITAKPITAVALSPHHPEAILVGTSFYGIYETKDLGKSWTRISGDLPFLNLSSTNYETISALVYHPENPEKILFACGFGNGFYLYHKALKIWEELELGRGGRSSKTFFPAGN